MCFNVFSKPRCPKLFFNGLNKRIISFIFHLLNMNADLSTVRSKTFILSLLFFFGQRRERAPSFPSSIEFANLSQLIATYITTLYIFPQAEPIKYALVHNPTSDMYENIVWISSYNSFIRDSHAIRIWDFICALYDKFFKSVD